MEPSVQNLDLRTPEDLAAEQAAAKDAGKHMLAGGSKRMGMAHLNGHIMCAVDVETTGDEPGFHDIIQICVLPLDYKLEPWKRYSPFYTQLQPKRPENYDPEAMKKNRIKVCDAMLNGLEAYRAADLFDEWFAKLNLGFDKRIVPLAQNWPFDRGFIIDWLGPKNFQHVFDGRFRDTMVAANFCNDRADFQIESLPYAHVDLKHLARTHNIHNEKAHDALHDCVTTAAVYKLMCSQQR